MCAVVNCFTAGSNRRADQHDRQVAGGRELPGFALDRRTDRFDVVGRKNDFEPVAAALDARANPLFQRRIERHDVQPAAGVAVLEANCPAEALANVFGQLDGALRVSGVIAERFQDRFQLADRDLLAEQRLQHPLHLAELHHAGDQLIDHGRRSAAQFVEQVLHGIASKQFVGVPADGFAQMHCQGIARIEHLRVQRALGDGHIGDLDAILILIEPHVVADPDFRQNDADLGCEALPHLLDSFEQIAAAFRIGQSNQSDAQFEFHRIDDQIIFDPLLRPPRGLGLFLILRGIGLRLAAGKRYRQAYAGPADEKQRDSRQAGEYQNAEESARTANACGRKKSCFRNSRGRLLG